MNLSKKIGRPDTCSRHSRECGNPAIRCKADWIPAFAGMTNEDKIYRQAGNKAFDSLTEAAT
jgi:hypothetical protein